VEDDRGELYLSGHTEQFHKTLAERQPKARAAERSCGGRVGLRKGPGNHEHTVRWHRVVGGSECVLTDRVAVASACSQGPVPLDRLLTIHLYTFSVHIVRRHQVEEVRVRALRCTMDKQTDNSGPCLLEGLEDLAEHPLRHPNAGVVDREHKVELPRFDLPCASVETEPRFRALPVARKHLCQLALGAVCLRRNMSYASSYLTNTDDTSPVAIIPVVNMPQVVVGKCMC